MAAYYSATPTPNYLRGHNDGSDLEPATKTAILLTAVLLSIVWICCHQFTTPQYVPDYPTSEPQKEIVIDIEDQLPRLVRRNI